jgi:glyoxylase-like metal-dependent hydrolase (beta-lactamase superfamily II)
VSLVVNFHLHFDHCGGNPHFGGTPIVTQAVELSLGRGQDHTSPELVNFPGATYHELDGEAEIWPGAWVIPTPGHTAGHQSLVVRTARPSCATAPPRLGLWLDTSDQTPQQTVDTILAALPDASLPA